MCGLKAAEGRNGTGECPLRESDCVGSAGRDFSAVECIEPVVSDVDMFLLREDCAGETSLIAESGVARPDLSRLLD